MEIKNKIIVITGASAGIGLATARLLASGGARLALVARSEDKLKALEEELWALGLVADLEDPEQAKMAINKVVEHFGGVDILINNAGLGLYGALERVRLGDFQRIFNLNVLSPLAAMQTVIPVMRERGGGTIVNISSMVSKMSLPNLGAYAATKYALNAITQTARAELAKDKIVVSAVLPTLTKTDFGKNSIKSDEAALRMESREGLPEADPPERVAKLILQTIENGAAETLAR